MASPPLFKYFNLLTLTGCFGLGLCAPLCAVLPTAQAQAWDGTPTEAADEPSTAEPPPPITRVQLGLGAGLGSHSQQLPTGNDAQSLTSDPLAMVSVEAELEHGTDHGSALGLRLRYQTTIAQQASLAATPGVTVTAAARSQVISGETLLWLPLGDPPVPLRLVAGLGLGIAGFNTDEPLPFPEHTLGMATARLGAELSISAVRVELTPLFGLQLALHDDLTDLGFSRGGYHYGLGGHVDVSLHPRLSLRALGSLRHFVLGADAAAADFTSTVVSVTLGVLVQLS